MIDDSDNNLFTQTAEGCLKIKLALGYLTIAGNPGSTPPKKAHSGANKPLFSMVWVWVWGEGGKKTR